MKTKKGILKDHAAVPKPQVESVLNAMQEYADQEKQALKERIRTAVADYIKSEGCSCCRGSDHDKHQTILARLLDVPRYSDDSGNNFVLFRSEYQTVTQKL